MKVTRAAFARRRNHALAIASEGLSPLLRLAGRIASRGPSTPPSSWRRGLIIGHSHIGDILYRTCSLAQLAEGLPGCRWDYLTTPAAAPILAGNPAVASVLPFTFGDDSVATSRTSFRAHRAADYDVVLCTNTIRLAPDFAFAAALGIPNRIGFGNKGYTGLLSHAVPLRHPMPHAGYFQSMVANVVGRRADWPLVPSIFPGAGDRQLAAACLDRLSLDATLPTLACTATTRQAVGAWPPSFFADVLARFVSLAPANIVLFGAAVDTPVLASIARAVPSQVHVVAGELTWPAFAEVLRQCDVLLATDSGPRHLANAVGTPVAFARNLSFWRIETGVYCATELDLVPPLLEHIDERDVPAAVASVSTRDTADRLHALIRR